MGGLSRLRAAGEKYLLHDEDGNATIEAVLWLPIFVLFFALIVDASLMFNAQANLTRVVQDANRLCSVKQLNSVTAMQDYIAKRLGSRVANATRTEINTDCGTKTLVSTEVKVDAGLYMAVGAFDALDHIQLVVRGQQMREL